MPVCLISHFASCQLVCFPFLHYTNFCVLVLHYPDLCFPSLHLTGLLYRKGVLDKISKRAKKEITIEGHHNEPSHRSGSAISESST